MDSNYLKELEEEIQKRKAEAEFQFNQANLNSKKLDSKNSNQNLDIESDNNAEQEQEPEQEEIEQSQENNINNNNNLEEDNDIVNEGIKSLTDEMKEENNDINFELKDEKNDENINYEIQDINEPKINSNFPNLISMNQSGICQCCNKEFNNKNNIPYLLKCNHIFCKICLETYFTEKEGIKCPIDGLVGKDINDIQIVNTLIESKKSEKPKNSKKINNKKINKRIKEEKREVNININKINKANNINKKNKFLDINNYGLDMINNINNDENDNDNENENIDYKDEYDDNNENLEINDNENNSTTNNENDNENENEFNKIKIQYSDKLGGSKKSSKKNYSNNKLSNRKDNKSNISNSNANISNNNNYDENNEESPEQEEYNQNYCNIHPEQKITHFVEDTKELICIHCAFNKLKNNPTIQIKEIAEKCKEYLNDLDTIIDNNQKYSQIIQNSLNDINENKENEEKKIIEIYEQLINLLVTNRNNYLIKIEEIYQENTGNMNKKLENFAEIIDIAQKLKEDFEAIAEQAPYEFNHLTQAFNKFIRDMNDKSKSDLEIIQYNFSHDELNKVLKYLNNFSDVKTRKKCYRFDFLKNNGSQNYSIREININQNNNNYNDNYINKNINENNDGFNNGINKYYKASKELKYINFSNNNSNNFMPSNKLSNNNLSKNNQNFMNSKNDSMLEGSNNNLRFNFKYDDKDNSNKNNFNFNNFNGNSISESINNTMNKYIVPSNNYFLNDLNNKNSLRNFQNSGNVAIGINSINNSDIQNFKDNDKLSLLNKYKIPNKSKN